MSCFFDPSSKAFFLIRILLLFLLGLAIYYQTFSFAFVFDDFSFVVNNPFIKNFKDVPHIWSSYPVTRLIGFYSFALNYLFCQENPRGYHLFNFFIHLISTFLVWGLTRTLFKFTGWQGSGLKIREESAFFIALLFLVHPGQTQAVTYISQRFESIAAMFYLATVLSYLQGRISTVKSQRNMFFAAALIFAILGIFTKETPATIPLMILALELIILKTNPFDRNNCNNKKFYLLFIILGIIFVFLFTKIVRANFNIYFNFQARSESHDSDIITSGTYLLTQMRVFMTFLRLLIFPVHQNLDYDYPISTGLMTPPLTLLGLGVFLLFIFLIVRISKKKPLIAFGLAWILITFLINTAPRINVIFEHKLYLISFGFFLAIVCVLSELIKERRVLISVLIFWITALSVLSYQRNQVWTDEVTLWDAVVKESPHKARPYFYRGLAYYSINGDVDGAIADFTKAIALDPTVVIIYYNRGLLYYKKGDYPSAIKDFSKIITINPKHIQALFSLGIIYANEGQWDKAVTSLTKVVRLDPKNGLAFYNLSRLHYQLKEYNQARAELYQAVVLGVRIDPGFIALLNQIPAHGI